MLIHLLPAILIVVVFHLLWIQPRKGHTPPDKVELELGVTKFRTYNPLVPPSDTVKQYDRKLITEKFSQILNKIVNKSES